jgi:hypothetical protein
MEPEVAVEGGGSVIDRVHDDGSGSELLAAPGTATQSVDQKMTAQRITLVGAVED